MARKRKVQGDDPSSLPWSNSYGQGDLPWLTKRDVQKEQRQAEGQVKRQALQKKIDELSQIKSDLGKEGRFSGIKDKFTANSASDKWKRIQEGRDAEDTRGIKGGLKNIFDANTAEDKAKRKAKGKAENYQDEDGRGYSGIGGRLKDVFDANSGRDKTVRRERGDPELHQDFRKSQDDKVKRAGEGKLTDEEKKARTEFYKTKGIDLNAEVKLGAEMPKGTELFTNKGVNRLAINKAADVQKEQDSLAKRKETEQEFQTFQDVELGRQGGLKQAGRAFTREFTSTFADLPSNLKSIASNAVDVASPEGSRVDKWAQKQFDESVSRVAKRQESARLAGLGTSDKDSAIIQGLAGGAGSLAGALTVSALTGGVGGAAKGTKAAEAVENLSKAQKIWATAKSAASIEGVAPKIFAINTAGSTTRDVRAQGKDPLQALVTGLAAGWAEGKLEEFGLEKMMNPGNNSVLKQFATTTMSEGAQEFSQTAVSNVIASTYKDVDLQKALNDSIMAGLYGAALGGVGGIPFSFSARLQQEGVPKYIADKAAADLTKSIDKATETVAGTLEQQAQEEGALEVAQPEQAVVEAPVELQQEAIQPQNEEVVTAYSGHQGQGSSYSTPNRRFAKENFADIDQKGQSTDKGVVEEKQIKKSDILDTRDPETRQKLESVVGKDRLDAMIGRADNKDLPNHYDKYEEDILISAAKSLGYGHIALSETTKGQKSDYGSVISYVNTGLDADQEQAPRPQKPKSPLPGYEYNDSGDLVDKNGNVASQRDVQNAIQDAKGEGYLTEYEDASKAGDKETMARIAKEHPNDKRVNIPDVKKGAVKPIAKKPKVATLNLNEAEGKAKKGGLAKRVEAKAIEKGVIDRAGEISEVAKLSIKKEIAKATDLVNTDLEKARRILRGEEELPSDIRPTALIAALDEYATVNKDAELLAEMVNSDAVRQVSLAGQELNLAKAIDPDSATAKLKEIADARKKAYKNKTRKDADSEVKKNVKEIKKSVKKNVTKQKWDAFFEEIKCG